MIINAYLLLAGVIVLILIGREIYKAGFKNGRNFGRDEILNEDIIRAEQHSLELQKALDGGLPC